MRNTTSEPHGFDSHPRRRKQSSRFPTKTIALTALGFAVLAGVATQGDKHLRITSARRAPMPETAPTPATLASLEAPSAHRYNPLLDADVSFRTASIGFVSPGRFDPLLASGFLSGVAPQTMAESVPLYAGLRPPRPSTAVAALPAGEVADARAPTPAASVAAAAPAVTRTEDAPAETVAEPVVAMIEPESATPVPLPVPRADEAALDVPLPIPRPSDAPSPIIRERPQLAEPVPAVPPPVQRRTRMAKLQPAPAQPDSRSFFDKLFGGGAKPSGPALAYASPQDATPAVRAPQSGSWLSGFGTTSPSAGVAVYNIRAGTVTMPNGERLEAHSGLGGRMDDPGQVHVSMKGPTPPHTYDLTEREKPFHGVRALRLNPVGGSGAIHGRVGLLAHTYLLGPRGESNGCVSFKDYNRFLQAYLRGEIKRLVVVGG